MVTAAVRYKTEHGMSIRKVSKKKKQWNDFMWPRKW